MKETFTTETIQEGKTNAIIAYITLIGWIIAFVQNNEKKNAFAAYHVRQSLGIFCTGLAIGFVNIIPILGQLVFIVGSIGLLIFWILGLMAAANGQAKPVPFLGAQYQKWFAGIQK